MRLNCQTDGKSILCFMSGCWSLTGRIPMGDHKRKCQRRILWTTSLVMSSQRLLTVGGMGILRRHFPSGLCSTWLLGKGMVQKRILGNSSRYEEIPQYKHCNKSMRSIRLNLQTIGLWTIQTVGPRDDIDGQRTDQQKRGVV